MRVFRFSAIVLFSVWPAAASAAAPCEVPPGVSPYGDAGLQGAAATPLSPVTGRSFAVASLAAFEDAVDAAGPGDEIVVKDGVYRDWGEFKLDASGRDGAPLIFRAETPLGVTFTGKASLFLKGSHLEVAGFQFKDSEGWAMVGLPGRNHVRITGNRFENTGTEGGREVLRILSEAKGYEIDNNDFSRMNQQGVILYADTTDPQHHRLHHNWFHDTPKQPGNGREAFTSIGGQAHIDVADMQSSVDHNFFERWSGEAELISLKASGYEVRNNSVLESDSLLNIRTATKVVLADNILVNSRGIGVNGKGNRITGNRCYGTSSCLILFGLSKVDKKDYGRAAATDNVISDNLFSSGESPPIEIFYRDKTIVDPVENNILENNVFVTKAGRWLKVQGNPDSAFLDRNKVSGGSISSSAGPLAVPAGVLNEAPKLDLTPPPAPAGVCGNG